MSYLSLDILMDGSYASNDIFFRSTPLYTVVVK